MRPRSSRNASSESRGTSTIGIAAAEVFGHPRGQQHATAVWLFNHEVDASRVKDAPENHDALTSARMMGILNDNFEQMFLGSMS